MVITLREVENALEQAENQYYRLVLLLGASRTGKAPVLCELGERLDRPVANVNLAITEGLLDCSPRKRPFRAQEILRATVRNAGDGPVMLDHIEVLFDTALKLDPLAVLQEVSRNRTILAAWPGRLVDGRLCYATREHPEFRQYPDPDAILLEMEAH